MAETFSIQKYTGGEASLGTLNAPITEIETALNTLSSRISNLNTKSAVIRQYVPISNLVTPGMLVYFNSSTALFEPAIAMLLGNPGTNGASVEAPCSRVEGLILSVDASGVTGTLLTGGYYESTVLASACLGSGATAGTYYLSPLVAGKATKDTAGHLRQPVLSYYGSGKFSLSLFYMAHDNHMHGSAILTGTWNTIDNAPEGITPPADTTFFYVDDDSEDAFDTLGELTEATTAVFLSGLLQPPGANFVISDGILWYKGATAPVSGTVTIFNHYAFAYGSALIRSVESGSSALSAVTSNGAVKLKLADYIAGGTVASRLAISAITGRTITYTPVISGISASPGVVVTTTTTGNVVIGLSNFLGVPLDAQDYNNNGTLRTSDGLFTYTVFPKSRTSSIAISMPVQDVAAGTELSASVWASIVSANLALSVAMYFIPQPTASSPATMPSTPGATGALVFSAGAASAIYFKETAEKIRFTGPGLLVAVLSVTGTAPAVDVKALRMGFRLAVVAAAAEEEAAQMTTMSAMTGTMTSGYSAVKYDLVYASGSQLLLCTSATVSLANSLVGIALGTIASGGSLEFLVSGIIQDTSFDFTPGIPVYVGTNGRLVQSVEPTALYSQKVGMALTAKAVLIQIEPAVVL